MKMRSFVFAVVLTTICSAASYADSGRDVLLTPNGTVYTVESVAAEGNTSSSLALTIDDGSSSLRQIVPESVDAGYNFNPAITYDSESDTLFVVWLRMPNIMSSEILLASYHNGVWQPAISIDDKSFRLRYNLRVAVRRRVAEPQSDGSLHDIPALVIHTVWWEQSGDGELARHALVAIDKGVVSNIELHDLGEFLPPSTDTTPIVPDAAFNRELLKHPAIIDTTSADSVDVVFGDLRTNSLSRVTLRPIAETRIHVPIGHSGGDGGGGHLGIPLAFSADWSGRVSATISHDNTALLLYNISQSAVNFLLYSDGKWSVSKTVPLNDRLSADGAIAALARMLNQ